MTPDSLLQDPLFYILLVICFSTVGLVVNTVLARLRKLETDQANLRARINDEICVSQKLIEEKVEKSNQEVLTAIKELSGDSVHKNDCASAQKLLAQQRDSWIKIQELKFRNLNPLQTPKHLKI